MKLFLKPLFLIILFHCQSVNATTTEALIIINNQIVAPFTYSFEDKVLPSAITITSSLKNAMPHIESANKSYDGASCYVLDTKTTNEYNKNELLFDVKIDAEQQWVLSFAWQDRGEEEHAKDGIFVSYDGGQHYAKLKGFATDLSVVDVWYTEQLALEPNVGSALIKFVQYDNAADGADGIALDYINVAATDLLVSVDFEKECNKYVSLASTMNGKISFEKDTIYDQGTYVCLSHNSVSATNNLNIMQMNFYAPAGAATLQFDWLDIEEESHSEDGVFVSYDLGKSFEKIMDFQAGNHPDFEWDRVQIPMQITNSKVIVQFREYDNSFAPNDGIGLDNIMVNTVNNYAVSTMQYVDNITKKNDYDFYINNNILSIEMLQNNAAPLTVKDASGVDLKLVSSNNEYVYFELKNELYPLQVAFHNQVSIISSQDMSVATVSVVAP